jgi:hypothetical protein
MLGVMVVLMVLVLLAGFVATLIRIPVAAASQGKVT